MSQPHDKGKHRNWKKKKKKKKKKTNSLCTEPLLFLKWAQWSAFYSKTFPFSYRLLTSYFFSLLPLLENCCSKFLMCVVYFCPLLTFQTLHVTEAFKLIATCANEEIRTLTYDWSSQDRKGRRIWMWNVLVKPLKNLPNCKLIFKAKGL